MALALTRTAQDVKAAIQNDMRSVFDRPTRFTLNSLYVWPAKKTRLSASVEVKDIGGKAIAPSYWLAPEIYGGGRRDKRTEVALHRRGLLPDGKYVVPGKGADLDQFGNIKRGQVTKLMSGLRAFGEVGFNANASGSKRSKQKGNAKSFFVMRRGREPIGVAQRTGRGRDDLKMVLAFVGKPSYSKRLPFFETAERIAEQQMPVRFREAMAQAMRTRQR
nr:hypothetical protein [Azomonas macrocytogenes]